MVEKVETELKVYMPDGSLETYYRKVTDQIVAAIQGPSKGGKTRLAATAPKNPKFFFDPACRLTSLAGIPNCYGKSYPEAIDPDKSTAWDTIMRDMNMFVYHKKAGNPIPRTLIFDDVDFLMQRAMRKFLVENQGVRNSKGFCDVRAIEIGGQKFLYPFGFNPYTNEINLVGNLIATGIELGCDVIAIFHEREEEKEESKAEDRKYTGKVSVHPPRAAAFLPLFNEYWRMDHNGSNYICYPKANEKFNGCTCMSGLEGQEQPNITDMIAKHERTKQNG
jgi:hypothetical protein